MRRLAVLTGLLAVGAAPLVAADLQVRAGAAAVGDFGLRVVVGSTCSTPDEVTIEAPPATIGGAQEACRSLTVGDVAVAVSADLVAGEAVAFGEGFSVSEDALLSVTLEPLMPGPFAAIASAAPLAEQSFNARFHLRLDSLSLAEGEEIDHLQALAGDGSDLFRLIVRRQSGQNLLALGARLDAGGEILTPPGQEILLPAGWNLVELEWRAGAGDGQLLVSVNQAAPVGLVDLANGGAAVERFRWGAVDGTFGGSPGRLEVDGLSAWR